MCLDDQILNTYMDGELAEPWKTQVAEHLNYCPACSARYNQLRRLHGLVSGSRLSVDEMSPYKEKVLRFMENNYISKQKKISILHRDFRVGMPMMMATAAAFVVILAGVTLFNGKNPVAMGEIIPQVANPVAGSIVQVRSTEGLASSKTLENYSLEEILQYLDSRGYQVDVRLKGIQPVEPDSALVPTDTSVSDAAPLEENTVVVQPLAVTP